MCEAEERLFPLATLIWTLISLPFCIIESPSLSLGNFQTLGNTWDKPSWRTFQSEELEIIWNKDLLIVYQV